MMAHGGGGGVALAGGVNRTAVFERLAFDVDDIARLTREVGTLYVAAYEGRLQQLADSARRGGEVSLTDADVLRRLNRDARDVAVGVVRSHNTDLRRWIEAQPARSQRALEADARAWVAARGEERSRTIVITEGMRARNDALTDVLGKNGLDPEARWTPQGAGEPKCAAEAGIGWRRLSAITVRPPLHPRCVHSLELREPARRLFGSRQRLWLGDWLDDA